MNKNRTLRKTIPFVIAMAIALTLLSGLAMTADAATPDITVSNEAELVSAVNNAPANQVSYTIALINDIEVIKSLNIPADKNIVLISGEGGPFTLFGPNTTSPFIVYGQLTLGTMNNDGINDGIFLTHKTGETGRGIHVSNGGVLIMNSGVISGNSGDGGTGGGGVAVYGGTFEMYGGTISNNYGSEGGGVSVLPGGTFKMYGGTISNNNALQGGGVAVFVGTFEMFGGTIENNSAQKNGGGVSYYYSGTVMMYGGTIENNSAQENGGGVWMTNTNENLSWFVIPANAVGVVFSNNRASDAYNRDPADDAAYTMHIAGDVTWSEPFTQGYNNYDISYVMGPALPCVSFDINAGDDTVTGLISDRKPILFERPYGKLPELIRNGYILEGWFTEANGGENVIPSTVVMNAEAHVLYAQWTEYVDTGGDDGDGSDKEPEGDKESANDTDSGSGFGQAAIAVNNNNDNKNDNKTEQNNSVTDKKPAPPAKGTPGGDSKDAQDTSTGGMRGALFWVMVLLTAPAIAAGFIFYKNKGKV